MQRHTLVAASYLLLEKEGKYLLLRRANTGHCDGMFGLPSGHVDEGESAVQATIREAREEINIDIKEKDLRFICVRDRNAEDYHRIDFYFLCSQWTGEVTNQEPHKCDELRWSKGDKLPGETIPYVREVIEQLKKGPRYMHEGWNEV